MFIPIGPIQLLLIQFNSIQFSSTLNQFNIIFSNSSHACLPNFFFRSFRCRPTTMGSYVTVFVPSTSVRCNPFNLLKRHFIGHFVLGTIFATPYLQCKGPPLWACLTMTSIHFHGPTHWATLQLACNIMGFVYLFVHHHLSFDVCNTEGPICFSTLAYYWVS